MGNTFGDIMLMDDEEQMRDINMVRRDGLTLQYVGFALKLWQRILLL